MAYLGSLTFPLQNDPIIDAATQGSVWDLRFTNTISWALADGFFDEFWVAPEQTISQLSYALDIIEIYTNVEFEYVGYYADPVAAGFAGADIVYSLDGQFTFTPNQNVWAVGNFPFATYNGFTDYRYATQPGDIFLNIQSEANYLDSYDLGSSGWFLILHETLHALGLKHTFDFGNFDAPRPTLADIGLDPIFDADWFSVMSYSEDYPLENTRYDPATPMLLDLLALQFLYGANPNTGAGNDTYQLDGYDFFSTIWDASGVDRVDASNAGEGWSISLPDLQLSTTLNTLAGVALPYLQDPRSNSGIAPQDLIWLTGDIENASGSSFNDLIEGSRYRNDLKGGDGNDTIQGFGGDDSIAGQSGVDTVVFSGEQRSYTLTLSNNFMTIEDRRVNGDGIDELSSVEILDFEIDLFGNSFDLRQFGGPTTLSGPQLEGFIELYIAYFNRAPDAIGLNFWGTAFANGTTLEQMASLFVDQDETRETYPTGTSNSEFATSVYNNVLGRTPDQSGINFWVGVLDSGGVSRDQFILEVLRGAKSELKPEEGQVFVDQQLADRAYLENKVDIGAYFAVHRGMSDVQNATAAMALFDGSQASTNQALAAIDSYYQDALDPVNGEFLMQVVGVLDNPNAV